MKLSEILGSQQTFETLDVNELEDLLSAVEYEQEEINDASVSAEDDDQAKLDHDFKALEAVAYVIKNNQIALGNPKLADKSIFLYDYSETGATFTSRRGKPGAFRPWMDSGFLNRLYK